MTIRTIVMVCLLAGTGVSEASAQSSERTPGDTLRFVSTMRMVQKFAESPAGPTTNVVETWARTVVVFGAADTIRGWVDSVTNVVDGPMGRQSPDVSMMLNKVFVGVLNADGSLEPVMQPQLMPEEHAAMFAGLAGAGAESLLPVEPNLPDQPLRRGLTWADTTELQPDPDADLRASGRIIVRNEVVGDSIVDGVAVLIIESVSEQQVRTEMTMGGGAVTMNGSQTGTGTTRKYYAPGYGLYLLNRSVGSGTMSNNMEGPFPINMSGTHSTEATMELVR